MKVKDIAKTGIDTVKKVKERLEGQSCWLKTQLRGVGRPLSACREGEDKSGLLCYPKCQEGYTGVGPICWQNCPDGFTAVGALCGKPKPYGRGVGDYKKDKCESKNGGAGSCDKWGLLWYPKCKDGFYAFACCICSPKCPDGMADIGISCTKKSDARGIGRPLTCPKDYE